jgi:hypothetical protein
MGGVTDISPGLVYLPLEYVMCRLDPSVVEFGQFFVSQVLLLEKWDPFEDMIAGVLLCLAVTHPCAVGPFVPRIFDRILGIVNEQQEGLAIESFAAFVRLLSGFLQVGLLDDGQLRQSLELVESYSGVFEESIYGQVRIQLLGPAYLAGRADIPDEIWGEWLDLMRRGWFSTRYFMVLSLLCFKGVGESGAHPDFEGVYQALLTEGLPDYPDEVEARALLHQNPVMPIERDGVEWLEEVDEGRSILSTR